MSQAGSPIDLPVFYTEMEFKTAQIIPCTTAGLLGVQFCAKMGIQRPQSYALFLESKDHGKTAYMTAILRATETMLFDVEYVLDLLHDAENRKKSKVPPRFRLRKVIWSRIEPPVNPDDLMIMYHQVMAPKYTAYGRR